VPRPHLALALALVAALGCAGEARPSAPSPRPRGPDAPRPAASPANARDAPVEAVLLGTAQDGGLPHVGCHEAACQRARRDPAFRRPAVSLGLVDRTADKRFLVEATPDLPLQIDRLDDVAGGSRPRGTNSVDGVLLTHAHVGHYAGLVHFGREVSATKRLPLWGTPRLIAFLQGAGPWSLLFRLEQVEPRVVTPEVPFTLTERLRATAIVVPHRDEFSDTVAFRVEGPSKKLLFLPDIDRWESWSRPIEEEVAAVDVALLDATFWDMTELPGRDRAQIPHPLVTETIQRLRPLAATRRIVLVHLNHSNPIVDPESAEARAVREAGLEVGKEGMRFAL
jgi:pyrroloquinoline quinone biosynthesis protein B